MEASKQETCTVMACHSCCGKRDRVWSAFAVVHAQAHVVLLKRTWNPAHVYCRCSKLSHCLHLYCSSTGSNLCCSIIWQQPARQCTVQPSECNASSHMHRQMFSGNLKHASCDDHVARHDYCYHCYYTLTSRGGNRGCEARPIRHSKVLL